MDEENTHIIQKFQFDLNIDQEDARKELLDSAHELVNQKIIPITERLMDEWADENTQIQFNLLEIDLGTIPLDDFINYLPDVYEQKIRETLKELFTQEKLEHPSKISRKTKQSALLDQLISYLKSGQLSWSVTNASMDEILLDLLEHNKKELKQQVLPLLIVDHVVNRLIGSLHADTIDLLLSEFAFPDVATQALILIGELVRFSHAEKLQLNRTQIEIAVYQQVFKAVSRNTLIFSGKKISRIFYEMLTALRINHQHISRHGRQFIRFAKTEKFLSQFVDIQDELKKILQLDLQSGTDLGKEKISEVDTGKNPEIDMQKEMHVDTINLRNAGLVLIYPYLKTLFSRFNWLLKNEFVDHICRSKALRLTDYIVYGDREVVPEHELVLNKLLCGMLSEESMNPLIILSSEEMQEADDLIKSAIKHWAVLKDTSSGNYQASFLQRDGILRFENDSWYLKVERKSYDLLLERLPFTIGIIHLPWMKNKLFVEW